MSKRMIDADILSEKLKQLANFIKCDYTDESYKVVELDDAIQAINELATHAPKPQENIFDADGWCWDMSLLKIGEYALLFNNREGYSVGFRDTIGVYADTDMINLTEYQKSERLNKRIQGYVINWQAWRPIPNLPKDKS